MASLPIIQLHVLKGEQQVRYLAMLEGGHIFKPAAVQQDARIGEQAVDAVPPLLEIAAAALKDKPFPAAHFPQIVCGDLRDWSIAHVNASPFWQIFYLE